MSAETEDKAPQQETSSGRLAPKPVPRRDFLGLAGLGSAGLAIVASIFGMARLPKPRVTPEASSRFRVGMPADYPPGRTRMLPEHNVRVFATDRGVAAMSLVCTHLGCIVSETAEGFSCPCHGSKFDAKGKVTAGPAPQSLPWLAVSQAADGALVVNSAQTIEPGEYHQV